MNKIIQILWADKLMTKARRIQIKVQKQQKYCAQQQKWYMNYSRIFIKVIQTLWAHKLTTKAQSMQMKVQKQQKFCAQQQKWYMNYCRIFRKVIQILWADKLMTKAQRIQIKVQKQQKYCAQKQKWYMNYSRIFIKVIQTLWAHKLTAANDESTKHANESAKATKVLRTTAKMIHELLPNFQKSHPNTVGTQANDESTKNPDKSAKATKVLCTTAKMIHELVPNMIKVIKLLRARRMIRLLPERYDLNQRLFFLALVEKCICKAEACSKTWLCQCVLLNQY